MIRVTTGIHWSTGQCPRHWARWSGGTGLSIHVRRHRCQFDAIAWYQRRGGRVEHYRGPGARRISLADSVTRWFPHVSSHISHQFWRAQRSHSFYLSSRHFVAIKWFKCCRSIEWCRPVWNYLLHLDFVTDLLRIIKAAYFGKKMTGTALLDA